MTGPAGRATNAPRRAEGHDDKSNPQSAQMRRRSNGVIGSLYGAAGQQGGLVLVGNQIADMSQQTGRQGLRRRRVEDDRHAMPVGKLGSPLHGRQRHFQLEEQRLAFRDSILVRVDELRRDGAVGAWRDDDGILSARTHRNQRDP